MNNYDSLLTMAALNMAIVSLHRITSTQDRVILDQEYKNIINNLRMGEINADPELTGLYQEIVRVISRGQLRDNVRKSIERANAQEKQRSIRDIISENAFSSFDTNPLKWLGNLAKSCASEYFGSKKQKTQQAAEQLKLKSEELGEYDELQRKLLASSWALLRKYQLSDNHRLTQKALDKFYSATQENDQSKRLRMLKYLENDFSMYSPYWFYRAIAAQGAKDKNEAAKSFAKFNEVWRPVLRKDPYKIEALKFQIEEFMSIGINANNKDEILKCLSEMRANTELDDWANNIYEGTLYFTLGEKEKAIECVMCNVDFDIETENSEALLIKFEGKTSKKCEIDVKELLFNEVKILAEAGYPNAQCDLGWMYNNGDGVAQNKVEAVKWYRKAAEQGNADAQFNLGVMYSKGEGVDEDEAEAVKWYRKAAEQGNTDAQCNLGEMYYFGFVVDEDYTRDYTEAVKWYRKAAEQGDAYAQFNLGWMYNNGEGVAQNKVEAVKWYRKAAEQRNADAQFNLGWMYNNGEGVAQNEVEAVIWYREAAEQGHADAQCNLGKMYYFGFGVDKDYTEAVKWYRKAAEQGNADAQCNLGKMYYFGFGVDKDYTEAVKWYRKATEQGHADAQCNLGEMYYFGFGVDKDYTEAVKWYRKAAEQGNADAQYMLKKLGKT